MNGISSGIKIGLLSQLHDILRSHKLYSGYQPPNVLTQHGFEYLKFFNLGTMAILAIQQA